MKQKIEIYILMLKKLTSWNATHSDTKHTMPYCSGGGGGMSKRRHHTTIKLSSLCLGKNIYLFLKNVGVVRTNWLLYWMESSIN